MSTCVNCGRPIHETEGGTWVHDASGRGICAWAEPGDPCHERCAGSSIPNHNEQEQR